MRKLTSIDTASVGDNAKDDQGDKQGDLQAGEPELDLAVVLDSEEVCCDTQDQEYRNVDSKLRICQSQQEYSNRNKGNICLVTYVCAALIPKSDHETNRGNFCRYREAGQEHVIYTHSETHLW